MKDVLLIPRLAVLRLCALLAAGFRLLGGARVPGHVHAELASEKGAAARLAVLNDAEREARQYGLSDAALGALLVQLGRDVAAGRLRR